MKTLIFGMMVLFGATMVFAQDFCDDEEFLEETAVIAPDTCADEMSTTPVAAPVTAPPAANAPEAKEGRHDESKEARHDEAMGEKAKDVVDTAIADGHFKTLAKALVAAKLIETLKGEGPFTIFAPTDEAFAKLPQGTLDNLLKPENKSKLERILTFHVVPGRLMATEIMKMPNAKTLDGRELNIRLKDGKVFVNEAEVKIPDLKARNGVIHVVDTVLMPKD